MLLLDRLIEVNFDFDRKSFRDSKADKFWIILPNSRVYLTCHIFHLMPVSVYPRSDEATMRTLYGLILYRTPKAGQYVKVGTFEADFGNAPEMRAEGDALLGNYWARALDDYLGSGGESKCFIEIV
jgi:hypothetical protein